MAQQSEDSLTSVKKVKRALRDRFIHHIHTLDVGVELAKVVQGEKGLENYIQQFQAVLMNAEVKDYLAFASTFLKGLKKIEVAKGVSKWMGKTSSKERSWEDFIMKAREVSIEEATFLSDGGKEKVMPQVTAIDATNNNTLSVSMPQEWNGSQWMSYQNMMQGVPSTPMMYPGILHSYSMPGMGTTNTSTVTEQPSMPAPTVGQPGLPTQQQQQWCSIHQWCGHSDAECRGHQRRDRRFFQRGKRGGFGGGSRGRYFQPPTMPPTMQLSAPVAALIVAQPINATAAPATAAPIMAPPTLPPPAMPPIGQTQLLGMNAMFMPMGIPAPACFVCGNIGHKAFNCPF